MSPCGKALPIFPNKVNSQLLVIKRAYPLRFLTRGASGVTTHCLSISLKNMKLNLLVAHICPRWDHLTALLLPQELE